MEGEPPVPHSSVVAKWIIHLVGACFGIALFSQNNTNVILKKEKQCSLVLVCMDYGIIDVVELKLNKWAQIISLTFRINI